MTKKLTISVPDEIAERLAQEDNVSAFIAGLVRGRMGSEEIRGWYRERGVPLTDAGILRAREERERLEATVTPQLRAAAEEFAAKLRARHPDVRHGMPRARRA